MAASVPDSPGVIVSAGRHPDGSRRYRTWTFRELDEDSTRIAGGLQSLGVVPGTRLALLVPQGLDFLSLVFALLKSGAVAVLIDPGMGRSNAIRCLAEADLEGFVAIPLAHAVRVALRRRFPRSRIHVTAGRRWFWGGATLESLRRSSLESYRPPPTTPDDPAAVIFTTGSTGPPKGVLYRHRNFSHQADEIRDHYGIKPGELDLPGFPLFALFNVAMGVTTVIPEMDPTRPADVVPKNVIEPLRDWQIPQAFGSPALWNTVGRHCEQTGERMPTLRRVLSAGAPVPPHVLKRLHAAIAPDGEVHTPYGATEALPVASIGSREVLGETAAATADGAGVCVGRRFPGIEWKVIRIDDGPLEQIEQVEPLPRGEIGELMVRGPVVTTEYVTRRESNALHKVRDGQTIWHRMGDVGYLDEQDRFWFCGRKAHRVRTGSETLFTIPSEAIVNQHPAVYRSALVGVGPSDRQRPVVVVETWPEHRPRGRQDQDRLLHELRERAASHALTRSLRTFLWHPSLPVDIRHNSKIFREKLAVWASRRDLVDR